MGFVDLLLYIALLMCVLIMVWCIDKVMSWWEDSREY